MQPVIDWCRSANELKLCEVSLLHVLILASVASVYYITRKIAGK